MGWVRQYRQEVEQGRQLVEVGTLTEQFGKAQGLSSGSVPWQHPLAGAETLPRTQPRRAEGVQFVAEEAAKATDGERLAGSSEVIESIFGKWKRLEGEQARSGVTGLGLTLGALVSHTSTEVIKQALASVPTKTVLKWCQEKLGKTVQATRRAVFAPPGKAEQKQNQIKLAA